MSDTLTIWPWEEDNAKPYFVNEEGVEWWVEKHLTDWATRKDTVNSSSKPLKAICFITRKDGEILDRVLVGERQKILAVDSSMEQMACKIDILRLEF
jgi:hypothetical protein